MTALFIEPHLDDAVLFGCYTLLQEKPVVATVFGRPEEVVPGTRQREHSDAMGYLGLSGRNLPISDRNPNWKQIKSWAQNLCDDMMPTKVYAPAFETGGHEQHNRVAEEVTAVFSSLCPISYYMTYRRGDRRSRGTTEIAPAPGWPAIKLRAMSFYASQIEWEQTRPWFAADDALREWLA